MSSATTAPDGSVLFHARYQEREVWVRVGGTILQLLDYATRTIIHTFGVNHLRGFSQVGDLFTFETGRRASTGVGVHVLHLFSAEDDLHGAVSVISARFVAESDTQQQVHLLAFFPTVTNPQYNRLCIWCAPCMGVHAAIRPSTSLPPIFHM